MKRLYVLKAGKCYQLPYACDAKGDVSPAAITDTRPISIAQARNYPILSQCEAKKVSQAMTGGGGGSTQPSKMENGNFNAHMKLASANQAAHSPNGTSASSEVKFGDVYGGGETLVITIENTHASNSYSFMLGDGAGLIADALNLGELNGVVVFAGNWDENTHAQVKLNSMLVPQLWSGLHLLSGTIAVAGTPADAATGTPATNYTSTASDKFFKQGRLATCEASVTGQTPVEKRIYFNKDFKATTERPEVRERTDWEFISDATHGIRVTMPALCSLTMTTDVVQAALAHNFVNV